MKRPVFLVATLVIGMGAALAQPRQGPAGTPGHGHGQHGGHGMMNDAAHRADMQGFMFLLGHRGDIRRTVKEIPGGVETLTESDVPEVATGIRSRDGAAMYRRLKEGRPIHARDPLFAELFRRADKITMKTEKTPKGLRVTETSTDPYVAKLIRRHAQVGSALLGNGHPEMMKNHPVPPPGATDNP